MASVLAAPRDGNSILGVAWGANLHSVRANGNTVLDGTNVADVREAIRMVGSTSKIIVMAFGSPNPWSSISDEIDYWYYNYDPLFVAAAGTGVYGGFVVFPAWKSNVVAVSGDDCSECSYGADVDLIAVEGQSASTNVTIGEGLYGVAESKSSSNATAVVSGIAALVWSKNPSFSRADVYSNLIASASPTGYRDTQRGWGKPVAYCAIGGNMCNVHISGPNVIQETGYYTYTVTQQFSPGPFAYQWQTGETTQTKTSYVEVTNATPDYSQRTERVTMTDLTTGQSVTVDYLVTIRNVAGCPTCP